MRIGPEMSGKRGRLLQGVETSKLNDVCVCAGPASLLCAETLRQNHYEGRIVMVTRDTLPPIDKPKLSKVRVNGHGSVESWHDHRCSRTLPKIAYFEPTRGVELF